MNARFKIALVMAGVAITSQAIAQVTFYEHQGFEGRSFATEEPVGGPAAPAWSRTCPT